MGATAPEQRWLNLKQAAEYCGYRKPDFFRQLVREYMIPRRGPNRNRYDRFELDEWMRNPQYFIAAAELNHPIMRRTTNGFMPIAI
jgi:predicted DNA-binding transcriptional regulator AlpA